MFCSRSFCFTEVSYSAIFNPFDLTHFQEMLQNRRVTWQCEHNANNRFFFAWLRKKITMLLATETTNFIRMILRVFIQRKEPYLWVMIGTCYEDTTQTTTFWILAKTFIHTIYVLQLKQTVHRLKMEVSMSQCTNETTQIAMDTVKSNKYEYPVWQSTTIYRITTVNQFNNPT